MLYDLGEVTRTMSMQGDGRAKTGKVHREGVGHSHVRRKLEGPFVKLR